MKFKVGDRVVGMENGKFTNIIGKKGTVVKVLDDCTVVNFDDDIGGWGNPIYAIKPGHGRACFENELAPAPQDKYTVIIYRKNAETIALFKDDKKIIKQASAKCHPDDEFNFEVGAKLAFRRLMGLDYLIPEIGEVSMSGFNWEAFKAGKFAVHCDTEEKAKSFLKECDRNGIKWCTGMAASALTHFEPYKSDTCYYAGSFEEGLVFGSVPCFQKDGIKIIDWESIVREVKRPAMVGEYIKITDPMPDPYEGQDYSEGDIFKVKKVGVYTPADVEVKDVPYFIDSSEYVVLENYQPEPEIKKLSEYTDQELIDELKRRLEVRK